MAEAADPELAPLIRHVRFPAAAAAACSVSPLSSRATRNTEIMEIRKRR
jgi:hypothetical protein